MSQANPCIVCKTDRMLRFRHHACREWWVNCEKCGRISAAKPHQDMAGKQWNEENPIQPKITVLKVPCKEQPEVGDTWILDDVPLKVKSLDVGERYWVVELTDGH